MHPAQRIVTRVPLIELWNDEGVVDARRVGEISRADIARLLRDGSSFVVADPGHPLLWIPQDDRFAFWKTDVSRRLVAPGVAKINVEDYPDSYCYLAAMWQGTSSTC